MRILRPALALLILVTSPSFDLAASSRVGMGVVVVTVENMHSGPSGTADVVSQAILGTNVDILGSVSNPEGEVWYEVETPDTYKGWIAASSLRPYKGGEKSYADTGSLFVVTSLFANVYPVSDVTERKPLMTAPMSSVLEAGEARDGWIRILLPGGGEGWIQKGDGKLRPAPMVWPRLPAEEMAALAKRFLGLPYLWGGTTPFGLDCSGFVQLIYKMGGIPILRDADIQFEGSGLAAVPRGEERTGDLVFFGSSKDRISHVGMMVEGNEFIHSTTNTRPVVQISDLTAPYWAGIYQGARRAI